MTAKLCTACLEHSWAQRFGRLSLDANPERDTGAYTCICTVHEMVNHVGLFAISRERYICSSE